MVVNFLLKIKSFQFQLSEQLFLREKRDGGEMRECRVNVFAKEAEKQSWLRPCRYRRVSVVSCISYTFT